MTQPRKVQSFASDGPEYRTAFQAFLDHTDQKDNAMVWLRQVVDSLSDRSVMIDAGAGTGKLTKWCTPLFKTVIAIEPNPSLEADLRAACPTAVVIPATIAEASPTALANLVVCSHVFYHVPKSAWASSLRRMMQWLAPRGVLAIGLANPRNDCMRMVAHFVGDPFDLRDLCPTAEAEEGFDARLETIPAHVRAGDRQTACQVAEFVLNVLPVPERPLWADMESYVETHFRQPDGGYQFSSHQDFLRVSRRD